MELINTGNDLFDPISEQKPLDYSTLYLTRKDVQTISALSGSDFTRVSGNLRPSLKPALSISKL
jgi:hypothetical protein